jgi:hypothetical protein
MKYIRPPDFKSVKAFEGYYKKVETDINALLTTDGSARSAKELNEKLSVALSAAVSYLTKKNEEFSKRELSHAFHEGQDSVKADPHVSMKDAAAVLKSQGFKYNESGLTKHTYIELQTAVVEAGNGLKRRVNSIIKDLSKKGQDSVFNVQEAIKKDFEERNVFEVAYANGAKQPLHAYAAMAARSARIESANIGTIGMALQAGTDYVKMTTMPQCCKYCGAFQGKVYSISGKDKRFPALFKTVLKNGYALPHPNCRHEFVPWFKEMETPEDVEKAIKQSKIKYDKQGNLVDVRYQKDINAYAAWQAGNRQLNNELREFKAMQEHYKGRKSEMPYKTLGSFRKARRRNELSPAFKAWRYRKMDANTIDRWSKVKDFRNCPKILEKLQEIKYNKPDEWEVLKRERATIEKINGKKWTDSFHEKAIDTYYHFREKGVEFTDHGVARYLSRMAEEEFWVIHNKPFNYVQADGRLVKYYNEKAIIYLPDTEEVVSCYIKQKKARGDWDEIKN